MSFPFADVDIADISGNISSMFNLNTSNVEEEILKLQSDIPLKARASDIHFWKLLSAGLYPGLESVALHLTAFFGSTYLCESAFSQMKRIKSRYRSRMTDKHLKYCLHMCLTNLELSFSRLTQDMQPHATTSHCQ